MYILASVFTAGVAKSAAVGHHKSQVSCGFLRSCVWLGSFAATTMTHATRVERESALCEDFENVNQLTSVPLIARPVRVCRWAVW